MKNKKKILVLCPSPFGTAATQRLKYEQYFEEFEKNGYKMEISSFQSERFWKIIYKEGRTLEKILWTIIGYGKRIVDLFRLPFYDGVYISLWVTPLGFPIFEKLVCMINNNVIYDIDDMIFLQNGQENKKSNTRIIDRLKGKRKPITLIKNSKYVIVCTPNLEKFAKKYNKNVIDISSTFDTNRFVPVRRYEQTDKITIGWTGTHSTLKYLDLLKGVLIEVSNKRKIKLLVISNKEYDIDGVEVEWRHWSAETEIKDLHDMHIGLYPGLKDKWSLGKSGLKALTYMSIGIPAIATAWGANFRIIDHGKNGFLANNDQEWIDLIIKLIDDVDLRARIGKAGRKKVEAHFSISANKKNT